jgi:D-xylose 1-dehydrogenase (NADP+, D-xylono-1,5-lactone-forming)
VGVSWGLLSTARINDKVLAGARASSEVDVVAVASRDARRAADYARERGIPSSHGSYEDLLADDAVDAVYVPLPNALHVEWTVRALRAGKHVLVEKPFDRRVAPVERAFDVAEEHGLVLSEGFMWRHNPQTTRLVELVREGAVGDVRLVRAAFSFALDREVDVRWEAELDGGALMDVGSYCVNAARLLCGEPTEMHGAGVGDGVDRRFAGVLRFGADGPLAVFDCGFDLPARGSLEVVGSAGTILVRDPWHVREPGIEVDGEHVAVEPADSYRLELEDVSRAIRDGRPPLLGRADAVGQARVLEGLLG